jgi:hypothetical protein
VPENTKSVFLLVSFQEANENFSTLMDRKEYNHAYGKKYDKSAYINDLLIFMKVSMNDSWLNVFLTDNGIVLCSECYFRHKTGSQA